MINFNMNMPFYLMVFYGSIMIACVLLLRALLRNKLPKFVFPALWTFILLRLLIPYSVSSPLSMKVPAFSIFSNITFFAENEPVSVSTAEQAQEGPGLADGSPLIPIEDTHSYNVTSDSVFEAAIAEQTAIINGSSDHSYFSYPVRFSYRGVLFLYLTGLAVTVSILLYQKFRYSACLKNSLLVEHNETINTLLREMNMGHILVFTNDEIASPLVCGLIAPKIYLPTRINFDHTELLRHILSHEIMHIRRGDNRLKFIMLIALCVHWFNPLVWFMSKYFASDIEAACDEAVLRRYRNEEAKKSYASSLLAMAITGNRQTLLYSAFSKTEVERRVRNILRYKKTSASLLTLSVCFVLCGLVASATGGQAPYEPRLTSFLASDSCRFGVRVNVTRGVSLGEDSQRRAERIIFDVMREDNTNDPDILDDLIKRALSEEFHVEPGAFAPEFSLILDTDELYAEYAKWELLRVHPENDDMNMQYQGETIRRFSDEMLGRYYSQQDGTVDVTIIRDRLGNITTVTVFHEGDAEYDRRTEEMHRYYW